MKIKNNRHLLKNVKNFLKISAFRRGLQTTQLFVGFSQDALCVFPIQALVRDGNTVLHLVTDRLIPQV